MKSTFLLALVLFVAGVMGGNGIAEGGGSDANGNGVCLLPDGTDGSGARPFASRGNEGGDSEGNGFRLLLVESDDAEVLSPRRWFLSDREHAIFFHRPHERVILVRIEQR